MDRTSPASVEKDLYDEAATMTMDGGMRWAEYWATPRSRINKFKLALGRRQKKIDDRSRRKSGRG